MGWERVSACPAALRAPPMGCRMCLLGPLRDLPCFLSQQGPGARSRAGRAGEQRVGEGSSWCRSGMGLSKLYSCEGYCLYSKDIRLGQVWWKVIFLNACIRAGVGNFKTRVQCQFFKLVSLAVMHQWEQSSWRWLLGNLHSGRAVLGGMLFADEISWYHRAGERL